MAVPKFVVPSGNFTKVAEPEDVNGLWDFPEEMGTKGYSGFIYIIRDEIERKFYLGKKLFTAQVQGRTMESEWRKYKSSNTHLKLLLASDAVVKNDISFFCLEQYKSRGALAYAETWSLCHVEAPTKEEWLNKRVEKIAWKVTEGITDRHKQRLYDIVNWRC